MHQQVWSAVDARAPPVEGIVVYHAQGCWSIVCVLLQALDVSTWLLRRVRQQYWLVDLRTLGIRKPEGLSI